MSSLPNTNQASEVLQGDCLKLMKDIPDGSIDMILADLPYGTTACKWDTIIPFEPLWAEYERVIKPNGAIVLFGAEPFSSYLRLSNIKLYKYDWIWEKENGTNFATVNYQPFRKTERISVFGQFATSYNKKRPKNYNPQFSYADAYKIKRRSGQREQLNNGANKATEYDNADGKRYPTDTLKFKNEKGLHPTQKPVALMEYLIKTYTDEGDLVLDNVAGSGTTGVACQNTNRSFILMEQEPEYVEIIKKRLELNGERLAKLEAEL